ncbi:HugZ family pyridoxamine 5'-phosphate oxidase [Pseudovibrio exalbescens]|uniref:CREG-like beta-barrel domain-containing protein n=1 Tax=Pseudovibrio exalbescens TaxID=197461 RepID=A0A1U7JKZ0_9HYPH|nr:pyridoxamine 5'-phosphate oxidase family protein [Pseudovibrio exalbescens]OKL45416.1 hypothetical protein A3843_03595 [Pseudovibrio exalbescens]
MAKRNEVIRETDDEARRLAQTLVRTARFGALALLDKASGAPGISRVGVCADVSGAPYILTSTLSAHTQNLVANPKGALLLGEPGKGDPLAHPRISVTGQFEEVEKGTRLHALLRARYLLRHPKAALYVDFADFAFFCMKVEDSALNGGFGKAYQLTAQDLLEEPSRAQGFATQEALAVAHINDAYSNVVSLCAMQLCGLPEGAWRLIGVDPAGMDLALGDKIARYWFDEKISANEIQTTLTDLVRRARSEV